MTRRPSKSCHPSPRHRRSRRIHPPTRSRPSRTLPRLAPTHRKPCCLRPRAIRPMPGFRPPRSRRRLQELRHRPRRYPRPHFRTHPRPRPRPRRPSRLGRPSSRPRRSQPTEENPGSAQCAERSARGEAWSETDSHPAGPLGRLAPAKLGIRPGTMREAVAWRLIGCDIAGRRSAGLGASGQSTRS